MWDARGSGGSWNRLRATAWFDTDQTHLIDVVAEFYRGVSTPGLLAETVFVTDGHTLSVEEGSMRRIREFVDQIDEILWGNLAHRNSEDFEHLSLTHAYETSTMAFASAVRNLTIYTIGLASAVIGALGLAGAIEIELSIAGGAFVVGLFLIFAVHEWLDGPF